MTLHCKVEYTFPQTLRHSKVYLPFTEEMPITEQVNLHFQMILDQQSLQCV